MGARRPQELEQPNFSAMGALSNKDLYDEAISGLSFARAMCAPPCGRVTWLACAQNGAHRTDKS
jgi:hypothetical protein